MEGKNLCMTSGKCHWSFPADENKESEHTACRTVPDDYVKGEWEFGDKPAKPGQTLNMNKGLCKYGCEALDDVWT